MNSLLQVAGGFMRASPILVLCAACACVSPRGVGSADAGGTSSDAGTLSDDAGSGAQDASGLVPDSGVTGLDDASVVSAVDAGPSTDASGLVPDSGVTALDDAGVVSYVDAGPALDAGSWVPDGGVAVFDGGVTVLEIDAGVSFTRADGTSATFVCQPSNAPLTPSGVCEGTFCWDAPSPIGRNILSSWAVATDDVWFGGERTLLHWDGRAWRWFNDDTSVTSLWASGTNDVWAVDADGLQHWDGHGWSLAFAHEKLQVVSGSGPSDVWVTAADALWRFDGSSWSAVAVPVFAGPPGLVQVDGVNDVWVSYQTQMGHWDGQQWTVSDPKITDEWDGPDSSTTSPGSPNWISGGVWGACVMDGWAGVSCFSNGQWSGGIGEKGAGGDAAWAHTGHALYAASPSQYWASVEEEDGQAFEPNGYKFSVDGPAGGLYFGNAGPYDSNGDLYFVGPIQTLTGTGADDIWGAGAEYVRHYGPTGTAPPTVPQLSSASTLWHDGCGNEYVTEYQPEYFDYASLWHRQGDMWGSDMYRESVWPGGSGWGESFPITVGGLPGEEPWAVGPQGYLARHLDGQWQTLPSGTTADLASLWTDQPDEVWAAGPSVAVHWTPTQVTVYTLPAQAMSQYGWPSDGARLAGASSSDLWLLQPGALRHFDGTSWSNIEPPTGGTVTDLWTKTAGLVWAIGSAIGANGSPSAVVWQGSGGTWKQLLALNDGSAWTAINGRSSNDLWLGNSNAVLYHFDGAGWTSTPIPFPVQGAVSDVGLIGTTIDPLPSGQLWIATSRGLILLRP